MRENFLYLLYVDEPFKKNLINRYSAYLKDAKGVGVKQGIAGGCAEGLFFLIIFCAYGLTFWYGSSLVRTGEYTVGKLLLVRILRSVKVPAYRNKQLNHKL